MYFIIKKLKYGKRLFMAVSLTPTMLPIMASLNYDGLNFVVISFFLMAFINLSVESKFSMRNLLKLLIGILFILFFAKTNMLLMLTLVPILFLNSWKKIPLYQKIKSKLKNIKMFYILISFLLVIVLSAFFIIKIDVNTIIRIFNTLTYPENTFMTSMILGGNFVFVPSLFLSYYWFFVIVVSILSDKSKFVLKNSIFSWTPFFLYVLHIFIALICYRSYLWHAKTNFLSKVIEGQQGRYFTPYILPFSILGASLNRRIKISDLMLNLFIFGGSVMSVIFTIYAIYIF
ncbi:MAG: DUF2142 domain-containing protein, partial [Elusimicrobiota bacterium]|jgi:uncharacterized membrane protein|nr:DUF2142 domain-containing protein [Elusimicrobiota bacterium]